MPNLLSHVLEVEGLWGSIPTDDRLVHNAFFFTAEGLLETVNITVTLCHLKGILGNKKIRAEFQLDHSKYQIININKM